MTLLDVVVVCSSDHSDQLCAGLQAGIDMVIHAMNYLFAVNHAQPAGWGVLVVDSSNDFNCLNCTNMLLHAQVLWPHYVRFLFNI